MKEKNLHKIIRNNSSIDNSALANALRKKHPEIARSTPASNNKSIKKSIAKRIAIFAPPVIAAVLAIILIPTILLNCTNTPDDKKSCTSMESDYTLSQVDYTVKEYNDIYGTNFLYFDWSNTTKYIVTEFSQLKTKEFLGLGVNISNEETGDNITYVICAKGHSLDFLENNIRKCKNERMVSECSVKWITDDYNTYGIFLWNDYDYYITIKGNNETRLFELIEILLSSQK